MSEKQAISDRSIRRIKAREASRLDHEVVVDDDIDLTEISNAEKAGTAEVILPTVMEDSSRSGSTAPPAVSGIWIAPGEELVTATVVNDEESQNDCFVNDITYATEVCKAEDKSYKKLPLLLQ